MDTGAVTSVFEIINSRRNNEILIFYHSIKSRIHNAVLIV